MLPRNQSDRCDRIDRNEPDRSPGAEGVDPGARLRYVVARPATGGDQSCNDRDAEQDPRTRVRGGTGFCGFVCWHWLVWGIVPHYGAQNER